MDSTIKIKPRYRCKHCNKCYTRKVYFNRHVAACELISKTPKERRGDDEAACDVPSVAKMYDMILALSARNKVLEERVEELTKWAAIRKKRLHVVQWLNDNYKETTCFSDYIAEFVIDVSHFNLVIKYDYCDGIFCILKKMFPVDEEERLPIMAFDQKDNTLFIKKVDGWHQFTIEEYQLFVGGIAKKIMGHFVDWQNANKHRISDENYQKTYTANIQKVLGGNYSSRNPNIIIRRNLYKYLKMNLKNVMQYEFSF